jgi:CheY-like chemotaxis protein
MIKRILLIDDDVDDADLFKDALEEVNGQASFSHFDGDEAVVSLLEQKIPLPDLIFLDINMPSISGWKCLAKFKADEQLRQIPVIMYTTSSQARERQMAKELGATGFITKPDDFKVLKKILALITTHPVEELGASLQGLDHP